MSLSLQARWPQIPTTTAAVALAPGAALVLMMPGGAQVALRAGLSIGQTAENDVVIDDPCVSRRHCLIERDAAGLMVRDLGSKNGTYVNEVRVPSAPLRAGGVLTVGRTRLRVVQEEARRSPLVGGSAPMRALRRRIEVLAPTALPLLIVGETGTGKELVARALHDGSGRTGPFVALNCGAIAAELVESELFGHERGAFTGATQKRQGVFQEADRGTLFLDEIGELPLGLQPRLLRALEVGAVRPVGATREQRVQARVIAATHVDLEDAVRTGRFREDLYYRLCGDVLRTPPLRERPEDIGELAECLLADEGAGAVLDGDALAALAGYVWPGNVRELRNVLRRAAVLAGPTIGAADLALRPVLPPVVAGAAGETLRIADRSFLDLEREILTRALQRSGGNKRAAAHALGIPKSTLCDKAKRYGIG
jgi:DNA-binding NtrC family response regulator